jgi:sulfonate transport system substrate-binding protein
MLKFKNKLSRVMAVWMLAIIVLITGCGGNTKKEAPTAPKVKKVVATYVQAPLNVPSIIEKNKHFLAEAYKKQGIDFDYSTITSGAEQTTALASGDIQILNCVGGSSVLLAAANGADMKVLSVYSVAPKAFVLFSKDKAIKSPQDLKGLTIAGPKGTILHELLAAYLKKANMTMKDVNFVSMGIPQARAALEGGSVQAALLAGPVAYSAQNSGLNVVTTGEGLVSGLTLTATSTKFYKEHKDILDTFLKVQKDTLKYLVDHTDEALAITAKETGLTKEAVAGMYKLYNFEPAVTDQTKKELDATQDFLVSAGLMQKKIDVNKLF